MLKTQKTGTRKQEKELTGKHVLLIIIAIFGVVFAVNGYMVIQSVKTFRGEDTKQSYRQGLAYNGTLEHRAQQKATGWSADIDLGQARTVSLTIIDENGTPVRGLTMTGLLKHPAETDLDIVLTFTQNAQGHYIASLPDDYTLTGKRYLMTKAVRFDGLVFETKNEIKF
ncbi:MAG: FixH family protein [Robiginitomaculum sp.]